MLSRNFVASFRDRCREHGLAFTYQRQVIYQAVLAARDHPTPEAIYETVRKQIPSISLGTVYKNINTFLSAGMLRELSVHHGSLRLDANLDTHHHVVCRVCRTILDIPDKDVEPARIRSKLPRGFQVQRQSIEIIGVCASCADKRSS